MKKILTLALVFVLCIALAAPVFAATDEFVPSIGYKDTPNVLSALFVDADGNELKDVQDCLIVTSLEQAKAGEHDISDEDRARLIETFEALTNGEMTLPAGGDYVVRDMFDVSFKYNACVLDSSHGDKYEELEDAAVFLSVTFDLDIAADEDLMVMYSCEEDDAWVEAYSVKNNGDGTVTVVFEELCPVAFLYKPDSTQGSTPQTGDTLTSQIGLWLIILAVCAVGLVVALVIRSKKQND